MKRVSSIIFAIFLMLFAMFGITPISVNAGQDDYIVPLFSGYVEDESVAMLVSQSTVIDMSNYNGVGQLGENVGEIIATSNYIVSNEQNGTKFCIPFLGTIEELNGIHLSLNGQEVQAELLCGENPIYYAGDGYGYRSIVEAIESVKLTIIKDEKAKLYSFEAIGGELEYSFQKRDNQTVIYDSAGWISHSTNDYSFKVNNSEIEEYPYSIFVTNGELTGFQSNIKYTVSDILYKDYVDNYIDEMIAEIGEEYRPYVYSKFNRSLSGNVVSLNDALFNNSAYTFALMKIELPIGESKIVVNSTVSPLVNALYNPYIYVLRVISPYPQNCAYTLQIEPSAKLPYLLEDNIGFTVMKYDGSKQIKDGYFVLATDKKVEHLIRENSKKRL